MSKDLATLAQEINKDLDTAETADGLAQDARLAAALALAEAQRQCRAQGIGFYKWAEEHIRYSAGSIKALLTVGKAADPPAALQRLRESARKTASNWYERQRKITSAVGTLDGVKAAFLALSLADRIEFAAWAQKHARKAETAAPVAVPVEFPTIAPPDRARLMAGR